MHPDEILKQGIEAAIEEIRPSLILHGGNAKLLKIDDGTVYLNLEGACQDCPMSVITFGLTLKEMLQEKFPNDVKNVVWD